MSIEDNEIFGPRLAEAYKIQSQAFAEREQTLEDHLRSFDRFERIHDFHLTKRGGNFSMTVTSAWDVFRGLGANSVRFTSTRRMVKVGAGFRTNHTLELGVHSDPETEARAEWILKKQDHLIVLPEVNKHSFRTFLYFDRAGGFDKYVACPRNIGDRRPAVTPEKLGLEIPGSLKVVRTPIRLVDFDWADQALGILENYLAKVRE